MPGNQWGLSKARGDSMADRNLNFNRDVTDVVAEIPDTSMVDSLMSSASDIADASAQSKVLEASSQAQIAFKKIDQDYRIKYEGDPENADGLRELADSRQAVVEELGKGVPSFYTRKWAENASKLTEASKKANGLWAIDQNYKNIVTNVENSRKNYLEMAGVQGQEYGSSPINDAGVLLNYNTAYETMKKFADENLSESHAQKLLEDFGPDYLKMTISGVAVTNPIKARKLLDDPMVVKTLGADAEQFLKFKTAIDGRAKRYEKSLGQQKVIGETRASGAPLMKNGGKMPYSEYASTPMSEAAKEYYGELNGFTGSGPRGGLTPEDKANYRLAIIDNVTKLSADKEMDAGSVRVLQDSIFKAMNKGAISKSEGMGYLKQIVDPLLAKKEATLDDFGHNTWFTDGVGFDGIQDYFDKSVVRSLDGLSPSAQKEVQVQNRVEKAKLYDYYSSALAAKADQLGTTVAELPNRQDRKKIYEDAQKDAIGLYTKDRYPALRTMPDTPNFIYNAAGELVPGMVGKRNLQPTGTAKSPFKLHRHKKTGELYRVYPDGKIEKAP